MISQKDLKSAGLETVTTSKNPTTDITANGEVQTHEEATVYVKELDIFLTMKVLHDTPAVFIARKAFAMKHGYSFEWINGQKPHLIKHDIRIQCNTENFVPIVVPGLSTSSSSSSTSPHMTPSRQEIDHPTSSSSSSTSPTMTSSTVSSESVERQERGDPCSSETSEEHLLTKPTKNPKPNKNENHEKEQGDLLCSDIPEWLQEFREKSRGDRVS